MTRSTFIVLSVVIYQANVIVGIQAERTFGKSLQILDETITGFRHLATHIDTFGSYIGQGIALVHIEVRTTRNGRCKIGILIHLVQVDVDGLQVTLSQSGFLTARIILDDILVSGNGLRVLVILIVQQAHFIGSPTCHVALREILHQQLETFDGIGIVFQLNECTALFIKSIVDVLRLRIIGNQLVQGLNLAGIVPLQALHEALLIQRIVAQ